MKKEEEGNNTTILRECYGGVTNNIQVAKGYFILQVDFYKSYLRVDLGEHFIRVQ